jgi:hypothetical protein
MLNDITNRVIQPINPSELFNEIEELQWDIRTLPPNKSIYKSTPAFTNPNINNNLIKINLHDDELYIICKKDISVYELLYKIHKIHKIGEK